MGKELDGWFKSGSEFSVTAAVGLDAQGSRERCPNGRLTREGETCQALSGPQLEKKRPQKIQIRQKEMASRVTPETPKVLGRSKAGVTPAQNIAQRWEPSWTFK